MPDLFFSKFHLTYPPHNILNQKVLRFIFNIFQNSGLSIRDVRYRTFLFKSERFQAFCFFHILFLPLLSFAIFLIIGSLSAGIRCL